MRHHRVLPGSVTSAIMKQEIKVWKTHYYELLPVVESCSLIVDCFSPSGSTLPCDEEALRLSEKQDHVGGGEDDVELGLD